MKQFTLRLPIELYRKVKAVAGKRGVTMNGLIISLLWEVVEK